MDALTRRDLAAHLHRLADGDRTALEPAFAHLRPLVVGYCRRVLGESDAEDAAHEALVTLFGNVHRYDATRDPVPWVLAFAVNACRTVRRRSTRRRETTMEERVADPTQEATLLDRELRTAVLATIDGLPALDGATLRIAMGERPADATYRKRFARAVARFKLAWRSDD